MIRVFLAIGITVIGLILLYGMRSDCMIVEGATFRSPQEVDDIVGAGTMHPAVSFSKGKFTWVITDVVIGGDYDCKLGRLQVSSDYASVVTVNLDRWSGVLYWNGDLYVRASR
jgi:hypothetical protein